MNCTCTPGSEANGWHEQRCADCRAAELAIWTRMIKGYRDRALLPKPDDEQEAS